MYIIINQIISHIQRKEMAIYWGQQHVEKKTITVRAHCICSIIFNLQGVILSLDPTKVRCS